MMRRSNLMVPTCRWWCRTVSIIMLFVTAAAFTKPTLTNRPKPHVVLASDATKTGTRGGFQQGGRQRPTLDSRTRWKLSISLNTPGGDQIDTEIVMRFIERRDYEPPQGGVFVEKDTAGLLCVDKGGMVKGGTWALSEDRNERKWGLWVWGLFEEPLYPYLYASLPVKDDITKEEGQVIRVGLPRQCLDFRFNHAREDGAAVLREGIMTYKTVEMVKADPLGLGGMVNVGESVGGGNVEIYPIGVGEGME